MALLQESPNEQAGIPAVEDACLGLTEQEVSAGFGRHYNLVELEPGEEVSSPKARVRIEKGLDLRMELRGHWFLSV